MPLARSQSPEGAPEDAAGPAESAEACGLPSEALSAAPEIGFSHIALAVRDIEASTAFYARFASMTVVHERGELGKRVAWLSDMSRPFVIVLIEVDEVECHLSGIAHLGTGCASAAEVDRLCALAAEEDRLVLGPKNAGSPVGYWALLRDPDGHNLELSYGQEIALTVGTARSQHPG
jgi:catechol 2,3-dioxygenase-like lactoylglutathione lyase family enzyme